MSTIYTDSWPGSYATGDLTLKDGGWSMGDGTNANLWTIATGAGGGLRLSGNGGHSIVYWNTGTWTPLSSGSWSEITVLNAISGTVQQGPMVCFQGPGASTFTGYIARIRGANSDFTFYRYVNGGATIIGSAQVITLGATDVYALQVTNSGATNTLTFFQNGIANGYTQTDTNITSGGASAIWQFTGSTGHGDIGSARGGLGLYPTSGTAYTLTAAQGSISLAGSYAEVADAVDATQGSIALTGNNVSWPISRISKQGNFAFVGIQTQGIKNTNIVGGPGIGHQNRRGFNYIQRGH